MENPIKMDDLGVPLFLETPKLVMHISHFSTVFLSHRTVVGENYPFLAINTVLGNFDKRKHNFVFEGLVILLMVQKTC